MSKQSEKIVDAFNIGMNDKRLKRGYKNPFKKTLERDKHKAYRNGYNA